MTPQLRRKAACSYNMVARLREGVWECPLLPFTVNDLSAVVNVENRVMTIKHARGTNGNTTLSAAGVIVLDGPNKSAVDLHVQLDDLELDDDRLRKKTPAEYKDLWDLFKPQGRVDSPSHVTPSRRRTRRYDLDGQGPLPRCRGGSIAIFPIRSTTSPAI